MIRSSSVAACVVIMTTSATILAAQSASSPPTFEVVSIKKNPVPPGQTTFQSFKQRPAPRVTGNRFLDGQTTLQYLVMKAYGVWDYQISGLPDWGQAPNGEHYDIEAKAAGEEAPSIDQLRLMVQALLADRFQVRLRREMRDLPVYALSIATGGGSRLYEAATGTTIPALVSLLSRVVDRPIVDKTGLASTYDFAAVNSLNWAQLGEAHRADPMSPPEALLVLLKDNLGLKLEPRKEPMEVIVIDHVAKPTPN